MKKRTKFILFSIFVVVVATLLFNISHEIKSIKNINENGLLTTGFVIEYKTKTSKDADGKETIMYYPVFKFTTQDNETFVVESSLGSSYKRFDVGEKVEIIYDKNNPENAKDNSFISKWFMLIALSILAVVSVMILFVFVKSKNRDKFTQTNKNHTKNDSHILVDEFQSEDPRRLMPK